MPFLLVGAFDECNVQIYNLGGDEPLKLLDLVKLMIDIYGKGHYHLVLFQRTKSASISQLLCGLSKDPCKHWMEVSNADAAGA